MSDVKTLKDLLGGNEQLQNWVKAIHFMSIAQTGLLKFVAYVAKLLHCNAMDEIAEGHHIGLNGKCNKCANPNNSCSTRVLKYMNKKNAARGYVIYERNINVHQWCENAWTIAWAFMGDPHSQKDLNEMDLYGFLKFMTNCRQFNTFLENQSICFDVLDEVNDILYSPDLKLTNDDLNHFKTNLDALLKDHGFLNADKTAESAAQRIEENSDRLVFDIILSWSQEEIDWRFAMESSLIAGDGLKEFVIKVMRKKHDDMFDGIKKKCSRCETYKIVNCGQDCKEMKEDHCRFHSMPLKKALHFTPKCPNNVCVSVAQKIKDVSRTPALLSWKNSDAKKWRENFWEVAKVFLPVFGSMYTRDIQNTLLLGFLYLISNCKYFVYETKDKKVIQEAIRQEKSVRRATGFRLKANTYVDYLCTLIKLLNVFEGKVNTSSVEKLTKMKDEAEERLKKHSKACDGVGEQAGAAATESSKGTSVSQQSSSARTAVIGILEDTLHQLKALDVSCE